MKTIYVSLVVAILNFYAADAQSVPVAVYYESLCPDSIAFVINQLTPAFQSLMNYMNIYFVPYGKASHQLVDGVWIFQCQHGPRECHGNLIQACALNQTSDAATQVNFVNCIMSRSPSSDVDAEQCATLTGLSWTNINSCVTGTTGTNLLANYGDQTHAVQPPITFVPTIIFNGVYDSTLQSNALTDLVGTVCSQIQGTKPPVCTTAKNRQYFWSSLFWN